MNITVIDVDELLEVIFALKHKYQSNIQTLTVRVVIKNINLIWAKGTTQIEAQKQHCSTYKAKNLDVHTKNGSRNVKKGKNTPG